MVLTYPLPQIGQTGVVYLDDVNGNPMALQVIDGTYKVSEPDRFGAKQSVGSLKYADFNPFESSEQQADWSGGYGLRRFSDFPDDNLAHTMYHETSNVDCSGGPAILSPKIFTETLTGSTGTPIWSGEFTPSTGGGAGTAVFVVVAGTKVYTRDSAAAGSGTWTLKLTLAAAPLQGAVGVFGGAMIFGFGAANVALYTTSLTGTSNVQDSGTNNLYVYAFTADRASAYIAGGTATTNTNTVLSSTNGLVYGLAASAVTCGSSDSAITALAPGGGVDIVFVGKTTELGCIDNQGNYRTLLPYDSRYATNNQGMRWWLGAAGDEQRGPLILVFQRDRSPWVYAPSAETAGQAQDIAAWADRNVRPKNIRGRPTCFQGTARWLYYAITASNGNYYIIRRDARTGANHSYLNLGAHTCSALGVTTLISSTGNPLLWMGYGNNVAVVILPLDGEWPLDDSNVQYSTTLAANTLDIPEADLGFPDEDKVLFEVRIITDGCVTGAQYINYSYALDGAATYTPLGVADVSPRTSIAFDSATPAYPTCRRIAQRFIFNTTSSLLTPVLLGYSLRWRLNPKVYRIWQFDVRIPGGASPMPSDDLANPKTLLNALWALRRAGTPVTFKERWNDAFIVTVLKVGELEYYREPDGALETKVSLQLLEATGAAAPTISVTYGAPQPTSAFLPFTLPWTTLYSSLLSATDTIRNNGTTTIYPIWTITGGGYGLVLTNVTTSETLTFTYTIAPGQVITINCNPEKKTVVDEDGTDLSANITGTYWGFQAGANAISVVLHNATRTSSVTLTYPST